MQKATQPKSDRKAQTEPKKGLSSGRSRAAGKVNKSRQKQPPKGDSTEARQAEFIRAFIANRFNISKGCQVANVSRAVFYKWRKSPRFSKTFDDAIEEKIDQIESALFRNVQSGDSSCITFALRKIGRKRGYGDKPMPSKEAIEIVKQLLADEITTREAAYQLYMIGEQIPDVMKIELEKIAPEEPDPDLPPGISDEELEAGYQRKMAELDDQKKTWVPERQKEIAALKEEVKGMESFGPDAKPREGAERCQS